jgi:heme exporter protein A
MDITPTQILTVKSLGIRRSERWLFRDLDFQLEEADVLQVIGTNGSGKTSLLRSLCGLLNAAEGDIVWHESDGKVCVPLFLGHLAAVKPELTVMENLLYHPIGGEFLDEQLIEDAIEEVGLSYYSDSAARKLSAGQIRRVGLARLTLAKTKCWILDEPFTSLDAGGCSWLEAKITQFKDSGGSVILTSHQPVNLQQSPRILEIKATELIGC